MTTHGTYQIHVEARGPHWVSWITRDGGTKPDRAVILVAASQADAEARAKRWAEQTSY
jgi:CRISPR/Cas system-associated protein Csm6